MRSNYLFSLTLALLCGTLLASCEKKEQPIALPPAGTSAHGTVTMGENYETQVFYDFESNSVIKTSEVASWDLAFDAAPGGYHVWVNGGKNILVANSHQHSFTAFTDVPASAGPFLFDDPSWNPDSTAVGDWRKDVSAGKGDLYIAKLSDSIAYKFRVLNVSDTSYTLEWCDLKATVPQTLVLTKDDAYSFAYLNFKSGAVTPDPPKTQWDVVFTRYRYIYRNLNNLPYSVNGVLLNPYRTAAAVDTTEAFGAINTNSIALHPASTVRDAVGFDWKTYDFTSGASARYVVNSARNYILHTRNNQVIKFHFLDFYSKSGVKGSPSFESERLQ